MKLLIDDMDLFTLRGAAAEWLQDYGVTNPNAEAVLRALRNTERGLEEEDRK